MSVAWNLRVQGTVQGVGFRPFVFRLARAHGLSGWVVNAGDGVRIHLEGPPDALDRFAGELAAQAPPAAIVSRIDIEVAALANCGSFEILESAGPEPPTTRIPADLATCPDCLRELFDATDRRHWYPYINCTNCGPRFSIVTDLPYDRPRTTMGPWALCAACAREYDDPEDRRFHAQPVACPACGPTYRLQDPNGAELSGPPAIGAASQQLALGRIVAIKGLGGYHLACDARNRGAVAALRERKFRKEKPFALMAASLAAAAEVAELSPAAIRVMDSVRRPIVLVPALAELEGVAPGNTELGIMLPYTPLHSLLFAAGAPSLLVMTSGNRSNEPIAYDDREARERLSGLADAFLVGDRPIARRVDDSVVRPGPAGPTLLRRARGYAPDAVAHLPVSRPILAVGADLKNAVALVVNGEVFVSQHVGDLEHVAALEAFDEIVRDLTRMYAVDPDDLVIVHDAHPQYLSTARACDLQARARLAVQHHRAHVASVLAERQTFDRRVVGVALDGTGYGDDGTIWGGEVFAGSLQDGFERVGHLRSAALPGGDAAARFPVQAAAGFLADLGDVPDLRSAPFDFPRRYVDARRLIEQGLRTFRTTSVGRLFDTVAALLGFTRETTFEGQAAMWVESLAHGSGLRAPGSGGPSTAADDGVPFGCRDGVLDYVPALRAVVDRRLAGDDVGSIARSFHRGLARGLAAVVSEVARSQPIDTVVLSGGVFQNRLLLADVREALQASGLEIWTNTLVPPNDGGICLGQAAIAAIVHGSE